MSGSKPVTATREFAANFAKVTKHYRCTESEVEIMKQLARENMADATISFAAMSREIAA